ncbi:bifunctional protein-serine/threonine kinase/phosphatase [Halioxenophilus aromaticivorans]|uniref:Bifunctional protein-serine/threonine kinase/phosphatase n=1 Tax=Halioxenophilus aromaticivorans TaxID=1306992 RepID=A0AAV3U5T9_9ALTE
MAVKLSVRVGQHSDKGRKPVNQDFYGVSIPPAPISTNKGMVIALADGISSSDVSQEASKAAVTSFIEDYCSTPESWSVKKSAHCVLNAINSWLHFQNQRSHFRYNLDRGYVCTFSGIIFKSATAHIFHIGDARVYQVLDTTLHQLTTDHRVQVSRDEHYLQRALGTSQFLEFDYHSITLQPGSLLFLATDGIYEYVTEADIASISRAHIDDLDKAAKELVDLAYLNGSDDNLTCQIVYIESIPDQSSEEVIETQTDLPFPPVMHARHKIDGYTIVRPLYNSARSHVYLAVDDKSQHEIVIKVPSNELQGDKKYLERFLLEEWIARRIDNAHVLKPAALDRSKQYFYVATEYIKGQTLAQWMVDNPTPRLDQVRAIVEQIARGLQAFHRLEMLHQDLRPENIMIDYTGTVQIIDFGATWVAGLEEISPTITRSEILGTAQYTAPEYFVGEFGTPQSDLFSLAVITYQMLSGRLPYGAKIARAQSRAAQKKLTYHSVTSDRRETPAWVDLTLRKALAIDPRKRYSQLSEFIYDLRQPNVKFVNQTKPPLIERNPLAFWQSLCAILAVIVIALVYHILST